MAVKIIYTVRVILHVSLEHPVHELSAKIANRASTIEGVVLCDVVDENTTEVPYEKPLFVEDAHPSWWKQTVEYFKSHIM